MNFNKSRHHFQNWTFSFSLAFLGSLLCLNTTAGNVYVPNNSFELPVTAFADIRIDSWEKNPPITDTNGNVLTGIFLNTSPTNADYIDNIDGQQGAFLFAATGVEILQDFESFDWAGQTHQFAAKYEVGKSYTLTVGLIGGGGSMAQNVPLQLALFYRDGTNKIVVASNIVLNTTAQFPTNTHFVDFVVQMPAVKSTDAWAGKNIGIQFLSTVSQEMQGGYWDLDNVRLTDKIEVPNGSFESPSTTFADIRIDYWEKVPSILDPTDNQLTGIFLNSAPTNADYIDNIEGQQAAFLFANPGVEISQDYDSLDYAGQTHEFEAKYKIGKSYTMTVGLIGGGGGMAQNVPLLLSLYYRDTTNKVLVASNIVLNTTQSFPTNTHLVDFSVLLPAVKSSDAWAGKNIGIQFLSTVSSENAGGYWDLDNVRLAAVTAPQLVSSRITNGTFTATLVGETGFRYAIISSTNIATPLTNWVSTVTLTNVTGQTEFVDTNALANQKFYSAKQLP